MFDAGNCSTIAFGHDLAGTGVSMIDGVDFDGAERLDRCMRTRDHHPQRLQQEMGHPLEPFVAACAFVHEVRSLGVVSSRPISAATVARLPTYLRVLIDLAAADVTTVSSDHLAELVAGNPATVRRDLGSLDISGTRGVGYDVKYLLFEMSVELGVNQEWPVAVIGAGNLGRALANYTGLGDRGFPVRAVFDVDAEKVGTEVAGIPVHDLDDLAALVKELGIAVGVVATPVDGAQEVADRLVAAGVNSILNFTACTVVVPPQVVVRRVDLATELQILSFYQQRGVGTSTGAGVPLEAE